MGIGQAYAVFYCNSSKEEIEAALPEIREKSQTPKVVELFLSQGFNGLREDPEYIEVVGTTGEFLVNAGRNGNNGELYVMRASHPISLDNRISGFLSSLAAEPDIQGLFSSANKLTAHELDSLLHQASSPEFGLFKNGERFDCNVFYRKGEQYISFKP